MTEKTKKEKKVIVIPARENRDSENGQEKKKRRVAAYARVSTNKESQQTSYKAQVQYYTDYIKKQTGWSFAGMYAEEGVTGTSTRKRMEFQRMIEDAVAGNIDLIITKSVSRFARNTLDLLRIVRHLKQLGVAVWFEEQNINSLTEEGELMLTLMASVAQAESESISENVKWAIRKAFQKGIGNTKRRTLGYHWVEGTMTVIQEEAEIVERIFRDFLAGESQTKIAGKLTQEGVTSVNGNPISVSAVGNILRNITYTGNTLLQKTFIRDPISGKKAEKYRRCDSKNISEAKLMEASAEVLGISEFDEDIFSDKVESITVQGTHELLFCMKDGTEVTRHWIRSRSQG